MEKYSYKSGKNDNSKVFSRKGEQKLINSKLKSL